MAEEWKVPTMFLATLRARVAEMSGEDLQWEQIEAVLLAYASLPGVTIQQGDWMDSPCPVCGHRIGAHKAVIGWMGEGCPTSGDEKHG